MRSRGIFDYDAKRERLEEVERDVERLEVWNGPAGSQALSRERAKQDKAVNDIRDLTDGLVGAGVLRELAELEDDGDAAKAAVADDDQYEKGVGAIEFEGVFT